jgi:hypothetical protein
MTPAELEALKHAYGLDHITDPDELRAAITKRYEAMNSFERAATLMKIGGRVHELEAMAPGARHSPPTWSLFVTALFFTVFAAGAFVIAVRSPSLLLRVPAAVVGLVIFIGAWRALARVVYRLANRRDW